MGIVNDPVTEQVRRSGSDAPVLQRLRAALACGADRLAEVPDINEIFAAFAASGEYKALYSEALRDLTTSSPSRIDRTIGTAFTILRNEKFVVAVQMLEPELAGGAPNKSLATSPENGLQCVLTRDARLYVERYRLEAPIDLSVFDAGVRLVHVGDDELTNLSDPYPYYSGEVYKTTVTSPTCVLRLREVRCMDYQWSFDEHSLTPQFASITMTSVGRVGTVIDLVAEFAGDRIGHDLACASIESMLRHPLHVIRWRAVQGLGSVDADRAIAALKNMKADPHPHIQAAASAACLELVEEEL